MARTRAISALPTQSKFIKLYHYIFQPYLDRIYPEIDQALFLDKLWQVFQRHPLNLSSSEPERWDEKAIFLITYGDSLLSDNPSHSKLRILLHFLLQYWVDVVASVHILPFFPFSSDDGFSVIDYRQVRPDLGQWEDIEAIASRFDLMSDLVINHVSSESRYFQRFLRQTEPEKDYILTVESTTGYENAVRPRSTPLVTPYETDAGEKLVWTTFSADQVDWNFHNPDVLLEFVDILLGYCQRGCRYIRLDAIGYLWKEPGTKCIHLTQTHAVVQFLNRVLLATYPDVALITETNVPICENLSYFGNRNEAHLIYNFSLPPLLLNALMCGEAKHLKTWMMSMPPAPDGCAYFNFTASHDGIGLRPTEGLLGDLELEQLLETMQDFGGLISYRKQADGRETPYELNISWFDAMQGTHGGKDRWQRQRFLCSQAVMMSLEGSPAFYIHSLLATPNDVQQVDATGIKRRINRRQWKIEDVQAQLADQDSDQAWVLKQLRHLMTVRREQSAFHPNATQFTMNLSNPSILGIWRQSRNRDQSIFSLHNLSDQPQIISLAEINLISIESWADLLNANTLLDAVDTLTLSPYQTAWISNRWQR
ncbi:MAG: sugar phosphorylase [Cyanobacteria bacterium P01_F01_bin.42]